MPCLAVICVLRWSSKIFENRNRSYILLYHPTVSKNVGRLIHSELNYVIIIQYYRKELWNFWNQCWPIIENSKVSRVIEESTHTYIHIYAHTLQIDITYIQIMCHIYNKISDFFSFLSFYFFFKGCTWGMWKFPGLGSNQSCSCWPAPQPQQRRILKPLSKARDRTCTLMHTSQVHYCRATMGTPPFSLFLFFGAEEHALFLSFFFWGGGMPITCWATRELQAIRLFEKSFIFAQLGESLNTSDKNTSTNFDTPPFQLP